MILTLDIPDSLAERLRTEAEARGEDLNSYAIALLELPVLEVEDDEPDEDLIEALREGIADAKAGRTVSLEEMDAHISAMLAERQKPVRDVWQRVQALEGQTLETLKQHKPFRIVSVLSDRVQFVPKDGNGTLRWFPRQGIEYIAGLGLQPEEIRPRVQQEWPSDQNTSYVAAIVYAVTKV
jgi:predicted transcriptional regulator